MQRDGNQYTVGPNDSFWAISQKTYGTGAFFKALYEHNRKRMKDPNDLKIGQVLLVPDEATLRRLYPDLCPKPRKPEASPQQRMITASARLVAPAACTRLPMAIRCSKSPGMSWANLRAGQKSIN